MRPFIFALIACSYLNAQTISFDIPLYTHGFFVNSYNSIGFSNLNSSQISGLPGSNPAAITQFHAITAGVNYEYATELDSIPIFDINQSRYRQWLPSSFGAHYMINDFHFGLGYHQKYSSTLELGIIEVTSIENPEGTGETISLQSHKSILSYNAIFGYTFQDIFLQNNNLSVGVQLDLNYFLIKYEDGSLIASGDDYAPSWKLGLNYNFDDFAALGLIYESELKFEVTPESEDLEFDSDIPFSNPNASPRKIDIVNIVQYPSRVAAAVSFYPMETVTISFGAASINWDGTNDLIKTNYELSFHSIVYVTETFALTGGIYSNHIILEDRVEKLFYPDYTYLNAGLLFKVDNLNLTLEVYDSRLGSPNTERTILKAGLNFKLDN